MIDNSAENFRLRQVGNAALCVPFRVKFILYKQIYCFTTKPMCMTGQ